mmetsp:Transcript_49516/g.115837  ORF Transcript_49516/g.115837 Transcript_49516/m.115837 type:complete len:386 (+) Transcript_49516:179-1336(+)
MIDRKNSQASHGFHTYISRELAVLLEEADLSYSDRPAWWWHPAFIITVNLCIYGLLRQVWGGSNYLPGKVWYALCYIIPAFVAVGIVAGTVCVPLRLDWPTFFHVGAAWLWMQMDLWIARWLCGAEHFGSSNAFGLFFSKLTLTPQLGDGGVPPVGRSFVEFNGALMHEIFWNICICQNFINWGWPPALAIMAVPALSCVTHAVTSNVMEGIRCAPQFCWVALAYHASGSVLPCGFIHAMWYMTDGKLLVNLATFRRDWDWEKRRGETMTPPPDSPFYLGWVCILSYYGALTALAHFLPQFRSEPPADCSSWRAVDCIVLVGFVFQIVMGVVTWSTVRVAMDMFAETGDVTTNGLVRAENAVLAFLGKPPNWNQQPDLPAFQLPG